MDDSSGISDAVGKELGCAGLVCLKPLINDSNSDMVILKLELLLYLYSCPQKKLFSYSISRVDLALVIGSNCCIPNSDVSPFVIFENIGSNVIFQSGG